MARRLLLLIEGYFCCHAREGGHPKAFESHGFPLSRIGVNFKKSVTIDTGSLHNSPPKSSLFPREGAGG
jgi:hypothetical protein